MGLKILEVGTSIFECFLAYIFFHNWFGARQRSLISFGCVFFLYFIVNTIFTLCTIVPIIRSGINLICLAMVAWVLFDTTVISATYGSLLYMGLAILSEYATMTLMNLLAYSTDQLMGTGVERASYIALAKLINLVIVVITSAFLGRNNGPLKAHQILPLIPCQLISIYICYVFYLISLETNVLSINFAIVLLGLLYLNAISIVFVSSITARATSAHEAELQNQTLAMQKEYYALVQKDQHETHALWHDINKYIFAMKTIVENNATDTALAEFDIVKQQFEKIGNLVDVENMELNAILNYSIQKAKSFSVTVTLDVAVPPRISVSAVDMSVIVGNTMDNAIEACQWLDIDFRKIHVTLKKKNDMLFYTIENPCLSITPQKSGRIHGYGLKNVRRCVEKYKGHMFIEHTDQYFIVTIRLNI